MSLFRDKMNKSKSTNSKEADFDVMYRTGFLTLDYLNGRGVGKDISFMMVIALTRSKA